jgi:hypothetical protein
MQKPKLYRQVVEEVITSKPRHAKFAIIDVLNDVEKVTGKNPTQERGRSVSTVINKLKRRKPPEVEEVIAGTGCSSGIYRYVGPATPG